VRLPLRAHGTGVQAGAHLPALDGLRGVAILAVMVFHFNLAVEDEYVLAGPLPSLARAGWCGVDLFFLLSGFLITGILLDARGSPHYFRNFYARRALRIFPLYYGVLAAVFLVAPAIKILVTAKFEELARNQLPLWCYYSNLAVAWRGRFFFHAEWVRLNHFWSLAIEEQFYLLWPAVVIVCRRRALIGVCLTLIIVAFLLRTGLVLSGDYKYPAYVLTPCRWDGLALGGLLAVVGRTPDCWPVLVRWARVTAAGFGLALAALLIRENGLAWYDPVVQTAGYSALALFFGAVLVLAVNAPSASVAGRFWANPFLRFFGKYSYGLYVVHTNINDVFQRFVPVGPLAERVGSVSLATIIFAGIASCLAVALAWLSWHLYEKHFLKLKSAFESVTKSNAEAKRRNREVRIRAVARGSLARGCQ